MLSKLINEHYKSLNESDIYVLNYISENIESCLKSTVAKLSKKCNVSSATIIRTTKKLGFEGYSEFKYYLEKEYENIVNDKVERTRHFQSSILLNDTVATIKLFEQNNQLDKIYELILNSQRIFAYGTGHSQNLMMQEFSRCLLNNNIYVNIIPSKTELELVHSSINSNDLLLVISLSGNIESISTILKTLSIKKTPIISVTLISRNDLASIASYNLYYQVTSLNTVSKLNNSSFFTLNLILSLLYEGLTNYIINNE